MATALKIAVVIPAHKRHELLRNAVRSILDQDLDKSEYELVVVDSSPDDSVQKVVEELAPQTPCLFHFRQKEAEGPGPSRNLGIATTTAPIIAFMDSDCIATPGWLRAGLAAFSDQTGIVQGPVIPDPTKAPDRFLAHSAGRPGDLLLPDGQRLLQARMLRGLRRFHQELDASRASECRR
jgi:glycosyltransferase involved in cell wall biosynthesis